MHRGVIKEVNVGIKTLRAQACIRRRPRGIENRELIPERDRRREGGGRDRETACERMNSTLPDCHFSPLMRNTRTVMIDETSDEYESRPRIMNDDDDGRGKGTA